MAQKEGWHWSDSGKRLHDDDHSSHTVDDSGRVRTESTGTQVATVDERGNVYDNQGHKVGKV